jgi:hypothetical protein
MRRMCFGIRGFGGWRGLGIEISELKAKTSGKTRTPLRSQEFKTKRPPHRFKAKSKSNAPA